jgi:hypothetical protein
MKNGVGGGGIAWKKGRAFGKTPKALELLN